MFFTEGARHPETDGTNFDFGLTHVWGRSRNGTFVGGNRRGVSCRDGA